MWFRLSIAHDQPYQSDFYITLKKNHIKLLYKFPLNRAFHFLQLLWNITLKGENSSDSFSFCQHLGNKTKRNLNARSCYDETLHVADLIHTIY